MVREARAGERPLTPERLTDMNDYWFASLYLCMGMIYLAATLG
jgi:phosphoketolase